MDSVRHPSKTPPERAEQADAPPRTLVEEAYRRLREEIVDGKFAPGTRLRVEHIKEDVGVGAGTLREALSLLVADALVVTEGQRGFWVAPMSLTDLEDLTRMRIVLETEALRRSLERGGDEWEADLVAAFHRLSKVEVKGRNRNTKEWEACNKRFHEALIAAAGSRWLSYLLGILYRQSERYRRFALSRNPTHRDVHAEHAELYEAALERDVKRATMALTRHIERTYEAVRAWMVQQEQAGSRRRRGGTEGGMRRGGAPPPH